MAPKERDADGGDGDLWSDGRQTGRGSERLLDSKLS